MNKLPPIHNTRSPAQWDIISKHVDFAGKSVIDLGCGYGDILARAKLAGASTVVGVENDFDVAVSAAHRMSGVGIYPIIHNTDVERIWEWNQAIAYDIGICFAVLPYLKRGEVVLKWMEEWCDDIVLIEVQYDGDGPGTIKGDAEMYRVLSNYWGSIGPIGQTHVEGRGVDRTIWLCR
jgi:SAM-dependent methyltransferase